MRRSEEKRKLRKVKRIPLIQGNVYPRLAISPFLLNQSNKIDEIIRWAFFAKEHTEGDLTVFTYELNGIKYEFVCEARPYAWITPKGKYLKGKIKTNMITEIRKSRM